MGTATIERLISPDEYLAAERVAEEKSEYFDGRVVAMAGARRPHNRLATNISRALGNRLDERGFEVFQSDMKGMAAARSPYSYPDVVVAGDHGEYEGVEGQGDIDGDILLNPVLIVEILSKSTEAVDRGEKFDRYKQIDSLCEYLLVSQRSYLVEQYTRTEDGWQLTLHEGLDSSVWFDSLECGLPLKEVYSRVRVGPYPKTGNAR